MGLTVKVDHPQFPAGTLFGVGNLGQVPNGESITVDEDDERMFLMARGLTVEEGFSGDAVVSVSGSPSMSKQEVADIKALFEEPEEEASVEEEEVEVEVPEPPQGDPPNPDPLNSGGGDS